GTPQPAATQPSPSQPGASQPGPASRSPRFDGAGIIERAATTYPGAPRHVLLAPDGRILAYLQAAPGVNLDLYRGRAMGVAGQRWFRPDLQSDFIVVRGLAPVRLKVQN